MFANPAAANKIALAGNQLHHAQESPPPVMTLSNSPRISGDNQARRNDSRRLHEPRLRPPGILRSAPLTTL